MNEEPIDLNRRTYRVKLNDNTVEFTIYGEDDDLNTLEMFITFLLESMDDPLFGDDDDDIFGDDDE